MATVSPTNDGAFSPRRRSFPWILAAIFAAALAVRLHYALACDAVPDFSDMALYNEAAMEPGFPADVPPGYPLFLRAVYAVAGASNYTAVYAAQAVLSAFTVLIVYFVARAAATKRAALFAAGVAAVYPNFIAYNLTTMTETVSVLLVVLLFAALTVPSGERARAVLAAVTIAAGYWFRPVLLLFAPGALLSLKRRLLFVAALALTLGPWLAYDLTRGSNVLRGARGFYRSYNPAYESVLVPMGQTELARRDLPTGTYVEEAWRFIAHNKLRALDIVYQKAGVMLSRGYDTFVLNPAVKNNGSAASILLYAYLPVLIIGSIGLIRYGDARTRRIALPALGYLAFVVLFSIFKFRYRLLAEPALVVFAGVALDRFAGALPARPRRSRPAALAGPPNADLEYSPDDAAKQGVSPEKPRSVFKTIRNHADALLVLAFTALSLRLYLASTTEAPINAKEFPFYLRAAAEPLSATVAPLYPLFLRGAYAVFGAMNHHAVFVLQGLCTAAGVLMLYGIVAAAAGRRAACIAGGLAALVPSMLLLHLRLSPQALTTALVIALMLVAVSRLAARDKALVSGVLVGAGVLLQPVIAFLVPGALAAQRRRRLFLIVLFATLVPYTLHNARTHRRIEPVYSVGMYGVDMSHFSRDQLGRKTIDRIYNNLATALSRRWGLDRDEEIDPAVAASTYLAAYAFILLQYLGLGGLIRCWRREHLPVFGPLILLMVLLVVLTKFDVRYRVPFTPVLAAYAALLLAGSCRSSPEEREVTSIE